MCRNHSHITCEITGHVRVGETDMIELRTRTPLEVQLPYGEKWTKSLHTALWVPVSPLVPLPASIPQVMAVSFTPLFYTAANDTMPTSEMQRRQSSYYGTGQTVSNTMGTYLEGASDDDEIPW